MNAPSSRAVPLKFLAWKNSRRGAVICGSNCRKARSTRVATEEGPIRGTAAGAPARTAQRTVNSREFKSKRAPDWACTHNGNSPTAARMHITRGIFRPSISTFKNLIIIGKGFPPAHVFSLKKVLPTVKVARSNLEAIPRGGYHQRKEGKP